MTTSSRPPLLEWLLFLMRMAVGGVFVYSGWEKLMSPIENFMAVIESYAFLKGPLVAFVAFLTPWMEFIFGIFLLLGFLSRFSAGILGFFSLIFIGLLARSVWLHLSISECGCFGSGITLTPVQALILDSGLLIMCFMITELRPCLLSLDERLHR